MWLGTDWAKVITPVLGCAAGPADVIQTPQSADLDDDGIPEAVITAQCPTSTSPSSVVVLGFSGVYAPTSAKGLLASYAAAERFVSATTTVATGKIAIAGVGRSMATANCCPDVKVQLTYTTIGADPRPASRVVELLPTSEPGSYRGFITPSKNIVCGELWPDKPEKGAICNLTVVDYPTQACDDETEPGNVWIVDPSGRMQQNEPKTCRGDQAMYRYRVPIPYGTTVVIGSVSCAVSEQGVTCTNRDGHGITMSRSAWRVF